MISPVAVLFGRRVRTAREGRGWTLRDLEVKSGVNREVIHRTEAGRNDLSLSRAAALADALGASLDDLTAAPAGAS